MSRNDLICSKSIGTVNCALVLLLYLFDSIYNYLPSIKFYLQHSNKQTHKQIHSPRVQVTKIRTVLNDLVHVVSAAGVPFGNLDDDQ